MVYMTSYYACPIGKSITVLFFIFILSNADMLFYLVFQMQGNHVFEVPNGYKMKITTGDSGF